MIRKYHLTQTFLLYCSILIISPSSFAITNQDEVAVNLENIKAPPRDVKDILKLLEQSKPDLGTLERAKKVLELPIPDAKDNEELNQYYRKRSAAFEDLGMTNDALKSIELAVNQYPSNNPRFHLEDLIAFSVLENSAGNQLTAVEHIKRAQSHQLGTLPNSSGFQISIGRLLTTYYVRSGNFEAAKKTLGDMENTMKRLRGFRSYANFGPNWEAGYESTRGIYFLQQGQLIESERSLRKAVNLLQLQYELVKNRSNKIDVVGEVTRSEADIKNNPRLSISQISSRELNLANVLSKQGRLVDAEFYARQSITRILAAYGSNSMQAGQGLRTLGVIVNEQGRPSEAVLLTRAALSTMIASGASGANTNLASARRSLAGALVAEGNYVEANRVFQEMASGIKSDQELAKTYRFADFNWILSMLKTGNNNQALEMTRGVMKQFDSKDNKNSPRLALARAFEAAALQADKRWLEADAAYQSSIPILVNKIRNDAENDTNSIKQQHRTIFLLENYLESLAFSSKNDPAKASSAAAEAFQIADIARASRVQRALTASAARSSIKDPQLAYLARQEQDLQQRITTLSELLTGLLSAAPNQQLPSVQSKIRLDIDQFKTERVSIKKEIEDKFPEYAELVDPKPASIERTQRLLKDDEVLVSWYFTDNAGYVWAISKDAPVQFMQLPISRGQIAKEVTQLRKALDPGAAYIEQIPAFDVVLANQLYQQILAPVESALKNKKVMLVVPHAELGQLPLALLVTKPTAQPTKSEIPFAGYKTVPFLNNDIAVAQIPSVTALTALRSLPEGDSSRKSFIGFGDPYFSAQQEKEAEKQKRTQLASRGIPLGVRSSPKTSGVSSAELALLPRLPDTRAEIEEVAKVMGATPEDIYLHKQASVKQVMSMDLTNRKVVMFSTHGLVPGELNGLTQPALALSSPEVTGDKDDGLLTMDKVIGLKINADWVVLSACNTASGAGAGSEAVSGLGRAFFFAGTKALLVSNWPVDSVAARELMTDLFKNQQKEQNTTKAQLLRQAMLNQINEGGMKEGKTMKYSYAHPLFWAPFVVVGD